MPFGAVLSFLLPDLIVPPVIDIYSKYYGWNFAAALSFVILVAATASGAFTDIAFKQLASNPSSVPGVQPDLEYGQNLNIAAGIVLLFHGLMFWLNKRD